MKKLIALLLCVMFPISAIAADTGYKIGYDGGSIPNVKAGTDMRLYIDGTNIRIMKGSDQIALVPRCFGYRNKLWPGCSPPRRRCHRCRCCLFWHRSRLLALTISGKAKHFIGLTWDDSGKKGGLCIELRPIRSRLSWIARWT